MALHAHTNPAAWRADNGTMFTLEHDDGRMEDISREDIIDAYREHADTLGLLDDMQAGRVSLQLRDLGTTPAVFMDLRRRYSKHRLESH